MIDMQTTLTSAMAEFAAAVDAHESPAMAYTEIATADAMDPLVDSALAAAVAAFHSWLVIRCAQATYQRVVSSGQPEEN